MKTTKLLQVKDVQEIVKTKGYANVIGQMVEYIKEDYLNWDSFVKSKRVPVSVQDGILELMPIADDKYYSFKYVNCHPHNPSKGLTSVIAFGALMECDNGFPLLISELTITTAIRTAGMSVLAAKYLARKDSDTMAVIGNGSQSDFQCLAFYHLMGIKNFRLFDIDPLASEKLANNLRAAGCEVTICSGPAQALDGADIVTTCTAEYTRAEIISADMVKPGMHINTIGGDSPGKTEIDPAILLKGDVFIEFEEQTRIEGEIQNVAPDFPVKHLVEVFKGKIPGRTSDDQITIFDSVGFALEDFSSLRLMKDLADEIDHSEKAQFMPHLDNPKNLYSVIAPTEEVQLRKVG